MSALSLTRSQTFRMGRLVEQFCGQDDQKASKLQSAADKIVVGTIDREYGGSVTAGDVALLKEFIDFVASETALYTIIAPASDGAPDPITHGRLVLSGEIA